MLILVITESKCGRLLVQTFLVPLLPNMGVLETRVPSSFRSVAQSEQYSPHQDVYWKGFRLTIVGHFLSRSGQKKLTLDRCNSS